MTYRLPNAGRTPMPHSPPTVSVVVPCRNEHQYIERCLSSILATTYPKDRLQVLVVDGMSEDGTREIVEQYAGREPIVQLLTNRNRSVPTALNIGIARASGEIILRMDAHSHYPPDYIPGLVDWLVRTAADNVGGAAVTLPGGGTATASAIATALSHPFGVGNARFRLGTAEPRTVDTVPFGCFRRDVFERFGGFDEELVRNQDDEFNFRITRAGGRVLLVPGVVSYYYARGSLRQLARMYYQYGYFKPLVARKIGGIMTVRQLVPPLFVASLLLAVVLAPWLSAARTLGAVVAACYAAADIAVSAVLGSRHGLRVGLVLLLVFPLLHVTYGWGFLRGCADFLLLGRRGRDVPLTR